MDEMSTHDMSLSISGPLSELINEFTDLESVTSKILRVSLNRVNRV